KADKMADQALSLEKVVGKLFQSPATVSSINATPLANKTFNFDASNASLIVVLFFYYLAKCHELNKILDLKSIAALLEPTIKPTSDAIYQYMFFGVGILNCMKCFLESESIVYPKEYNEVEIRKLPPGFKENISSIIASWLQDSRSKPSEKCNLEAGIKKIDAHVEAA
ncbi:MAG: hypothetical protein WBC05_18410, partial [Sedimentisphaerales bacterium]